MNATQEISSPDGEFVARIDLGAEHCSCVTTGYGKPYYSTTVTVSHRDSLGEPIVRWREDSESTGVQFSADGTYVEIIWEIAGCILNSSGTRYWRALYHLPSGLELTHDSSDFRRDENTSEAPTPTRGTASWRIASALEPMVEAGIPTHAEAIDLLQIIVQSGVNVSRSDGLHRLLLRILLRSMSMWSKDEVALRLLVIRLLHRVDIRDGRSFLRELVPRGRIQEPNRLEYNRLLAEFIDRLTNTVGGSEDACSARHRWWHFRRK